MSKKLQKLIDSFYLKRSERYALDKQVSELKAEERALQALIESGLRQANLTSAGGTYVQAALKTQNEPTVDNWEEVWKHIQLSGEFDLLHKRLNNAAVKERWDHELQIPGVGAYPVTKLSITKVK